MTVTSPGEMATLALAVDTGPGERGASAHCPVVSDSAGERGASAPVRW